MTTRRSVRAAESRRRRPAVTGRGVALRASVVAVLLLPAALGAQGSGDGFLFGAPKATLTVRTGAALPTAGGEVFDFVTERLTLDRADFRGTAFAAELGIPMSARLSVQVGVGMMRRTVASEFRDWVDTDDRPIEQQSTFRRVPLTVGGRLHLVPPGRSLSRLVWIPAAVAPYIAAGGGAMWYAFSQSGDFVDFETLDVFRTSVRSSGWTSMAYGAAGATWTLSPRVGLHTEVRYDLARAAMGGDFSGFDRIDLSGLTAGVGLEFRF